MTTPLDKTNAGVTTVPTIPTPEQMEEVFGMARASSGAADNSTNTPYGDLAVPDLSYTGLCIHTFVYHQNASLYHCTKCDVRVREERYMHYINDWSRDLQAAMAHYKNRETGLVGLLKTQGELLEENRQTITNYQNIAAELERRNRLLTRTNKKLTKNLNAAESFVTVNSEYWRIKE